ncbi:MAG: hypothetical protein K2H16_03365 [Prevotella sp.]|nr:hypothetical protein [Prevotella sp.]
MKRFYGFILLSAMVLSLTTCTNKAKQNNGHLTALADTQKKDRTGKVPVFNAPTEEQKHSFFKNRDEKSFVTLMDSYFYEDVYGEGLAYAIIAANRFNIPKANSYVYLLLTDFGTCKALDKRTEQMAMHYIRRGISVKDKESERIMKRVEQNKRNGIVTENGNVRHPQRDASKGILEIKRQVLNGKEAYYKALKDSFGKSPYPEGFLFYSVVMANRFDYVPANFDVYKGLVDAYSKNHLGQLDDETRKLAVSFLEYGAKHGDKKAIIELQKLDSSGHVSCTSK